MPTPVDVENAQLTGRRAGADFLNAEIRTRRAADELQCQARGRDAHLHFATSGWIGLNLPHDVANGAGTAQVDNRNIRAIGNLNGPTGCDARGHFADCSDWC